jgi:dCMP deaminase
MVSEFSVKWRDHFMKMAFLASEMSKDTTKVGCVIVGEDKEVLSTGFNSFPAGVKETEERIKPENKGFFTVHAEANAITLAKRSLKGATLFCTHHCCHDCAKLIIQSGIKRVYYAQEPNKERWGDSMKAASDMFYEAGVDLVRIIQKKDNINEQKSVDQEYIERLWQTHKDSFIPYTAKSSFVVDVTSPTKTLPKLTSTTSECGLPMEQSLSMAKPEARTLSGSIGHLLGGMTPNDTKPIGTDLESQPDSLETKKC